MTNHGGLSRRGEQSLTLYLLEVVAPFIYGHPLEISKTPLSLNKDIGIPCCATSEPAFKVKQSMANSYTV